MVRRALSLLIGIGYCVGQLAAVPHAHAHDAGHKHHAAQPHVHLSDFGGAHEGEHHHHDEHQHQPAANGGEKDHDGDAVYLRPVFGSSAKSERCQDILADRTLAPPLPFGFVIAPVPGVASLAWCQPGPNLTGGHCALFLTLQTLRI
jgi:hypothetical protein